jgi:hypothetical protein
MRAKKRFSEHTGTIYFLTRLSMFIEKWKGRADRVELERLGFDCDSKSEQALDDMMLLILVGVCPQALTLDEPGLEVRRRRFFLLLSRAPNFLLAALAHLRSVATPARAFISTTRGFELDGKTLNVNTATDGEIALAIKKASGHCVSPDSVKRERQFMINLEDRIQAAFKSAPGQSIDLCVIAKEQKRPNKSLSVARR